MPKFPPDLSEWLPANPPAPPIPRWLWKIISGGEVKRLDPSRPKPKKVVSLRGV